jgi:N-acetylmuramoyl-L-alanine amidase
MLPDFYGGFVMFRWSGKSGVRDWPLGESRLFSWASPLLAVLACFFLSACGSVSSHRSGSGFFDTVVIDAGHGGHDRGARAVKGNHEKVLALDISQRVSRILRASGLRVIETRTGDYFVPLDQRVSFASRSRDSIFVSIHLNWARRSRASGVETFFYSPRSSRLAANIQREIVRPYGAKNRGIKPGRYYVLRKNKRPAVLVELGFISNANENNSLQKSHIRQKLAEAVARGILAEKNGRFP